MDDSKIQNVVIIDIDGLRRDVLYNTLAEDSLREDVNKKLPSLSRIVGKLKLEDYRDPNEIPLEKKIDISSCESLAVNNCVTIFPTYTYPAQSSIFTGLFPKNHGVTANFHFDRAGTSLGARGNSKYYSRLEALSFYLNEGTCNKMLNKGTQTIYDYFYHHNLKCAASCILIVSQDKKAVNHVTWHLPWNFEGAGEEIDWLVPNIFGQTQFVTENPADGIGDYRENFDQKMMDDVLDYLEEFLKFKKPPPNLMTLYFGGHDHHAHIEGEVALQQDYLINTVDVLLGKFLRLWDKLAEQHPLQNTLFVICADHGHTRANLDDKKRVTGAELKGLLKRLDYDVLGRSELYEFEEHSNAVLVIMAGMAQIYVRKGVVKKQRGNWKENPTFQDLRPILKELSLANQMPAAPTNFLSDALDFILFKNYDKNQYQIYEYDKAANTDVIKPLPENFGVEKNYVMAGQRLDEFFCQNSGDILLLVNYDDDFRFERKRRMRSTHGSLLASDSYVPLIFATPYNRSLIKSGAAGNYRHGVIPSARVVDIVPTLLHVFNIPYQNIDGRELF